MRMLLLDVYKQEVKEVDACTYDDYYKLMDCDTVEIIQGRIVGELYNIIADESALMVQEPRISAIDLCGNIMLAGNLLIAGKDDEAGELTELSVDDIAHLKSCCRKVPTRRHPEGSLMLTYFSRE